MSNGVKCSIDGLADAIMEGLKEYSDLASSEVKGAVRKAGKLVKDEIAANAPKKTGAYSKSWSVKATKETSESLELVVYSKSRYQLAHLLEHGHAKQNGGRVNGKPHIGPAEQEAEKKLTNGVKVVVRG